MVPSVVNKEERKIVVAFVASWVVIVEASVDVVCAVLQKRRKYI